MLPSGLKSGPRRRVTGLRREEVATLAGVGVTWYTMLESGADINVSRQTIDAIGRALMLSDDELAYARALASNEIAGDPDVDAAPLAVATLAGLAWPAYVCTTQWKVPAWNAAFARVWNIEAPGGPPLCCACGRRAARDARNRFPDFAQRVAAMLRGGEARRIEDPAYRALYLGLRDDPVFAHAWDAYDVATPLGSGRTTIDSPNVGRFTYEALTLMIPKPRASRSWCKCRRTKARRASPHNGMRVQIANR